MSNEVQNILEKTHRRISTSGANRRIAARGDGGNVDMSNWPFQPLGLQWRGRSFIITRQLLAKRDARVASKGKHEEASMKPPTTGEACTLCTGFCLWV